MKEDTAEILKTLEMVFALQADHPLALHLYIHSLEGSPFPERAALAADQDFFRIYMAHNHHMLVFAAMSENSRGKFPDVVTK